MILRAQIDTARALYRRRRMRARMPDGQIAVSEQPSLPEETTSWLRGAIARANFYLEFGSGASTVLAANAGVTTISVESDPDFANAVRRALPAQAPVTVINPDIGWTEEWGYPVVRWKSRARLVKWRAYTDVAHAEIRRRGMFPDLVMVDGRFRVSCALSVADEAKRRGATARLLFDDYAGRSHYHFIERFLGKPEMISRAALFQIGGSGTKPICKEALDLAAADFR